MMVLLKCPMCGKELPDEAMFCTDCGYNVMMAEQQTDKKSREFRKKNRKSIFIIGGIVAVLVIILLLTTRTNTTANPFEKIYSGMAQSKVRSIFGSPSRTSDYSDSLILVDKYKGKSFCGVNGEIDIWYTYNEKEVRFAIWRLDLPTGKDFDDYSLQILKIRKGITKICEEEYDDQEVEWEDLDGNR